MNSNELVSHQEVLSVASWTKLKADHEHRVNQLIDPYLEKRSRQIKQPVMDFLFEYFAFRPSGLKRWSPGIQFALEINHKSQLPELSELTIEDGFAFLDPTSIPEKRLKSAQWILSMLKNTNKKRPSLGCFGMHEWAMVYKTDSIRHSQLNLRMDAEELAQFVESRPLVCTHFDAYRFFTPEATPLNKHQLSREVFAEMEQPGCIHTNMDLYKWAYKLYPWISSQVLLEAFELACEARTIDMKASPYDLIDDGLEPIKIETESGRLEYVEAQQMIFEKGRPIRKKLIQEYEYLLERN